MTSDPVHIGTGGYRLGRVDNSIVREPGVNLPKIPGTSLHGAIRSYAARIYENLAAAGQTHNGVANPERDPICYTFGYNQQAQGQRDEEATMYAGVVSIFDAQILCFPVYSMAGPVWVTTPARLRAAGFTVGALPNTWPTDMALFTWPRNDALNLGWLMLRAGPQTVSVALPPGGVTKWQTTSWAEIANRLVFVQEALFAQIVNSNLEVRTSVSINPERGAAEDGALFTYEALPRATLLTMDVVLDDYRALATSNGNGAAVATQAEAPVAQDEAPATQAEASVTQDEAPVTQDEAPVTPVAQAAAPVTQDEAPAVFPVSTVYGDPTRPLPGAPWQGPLDVVQAGLAAISWLGVGGMGTRGFGRLQIVGQPLVQRFGEEVWQ